MKKRRFKDLTLPSFIALALAACDAFPPQRGQTAGPVRLESTIKRRGATPNATTSIPRYKVYQDSDSPENIWVGLGVESGADTFFSSDSGATWREVAAMGWEFHMSMAGNANGYVHFIDRGTPGATYHRLHVTSFEAEHRTSFADYGPDQTTSGNIAVNGQEVVVFTRNREDNRMPVSYHRSTDNGATWQSGIVAGTGNPSNIIHRIGSCVIDGQITLAYWKGNDTGSGDTVRLYRWDGDDFAAVEHSFTTRASSPWTRQYAITQDAGGRIHLAVWDEVDGEKVVRHSHRTLATDWSEPVTVAAWDNDDIHPQLAAHNDRVILLYLYNPSSSSSEDARVYYRVWSPDAGWDSDGTPLYTGRRDGARFPIAPQKVAPSSTFVPVVWTEGNAVRFARLELDPPQVQEAPETLAP